MQRGTDVAIDNNEKLYETVRELGMALQDAGAADVASELHSALRISSMPGEVLGEVRIALQRVRTHTAYGRLDIRKRVDEGIAYVNRALG